MKLRNTRLVPIYGIVLTGGTLLISEGYGLKYSKAGRERSAGTKSGGSEPQGRKASKNNLGDKKRSRKKKRFGRIRRSMGHRPLRREKLTTES